MFGNFCSLEKNNIETAQKQKKRQMGESDGFAKSVCFGWLSQGVVVFFVVSVFCFFW